LSGAILVLVRNEDVYYNFIYDVPENENELSGGYTAVFLQDITGSSVFCTELNAEKTAHHKTGHYIGTNHPPVTSTLQNSRVKRRRIMPVKEPGMDAEKKYPVITISREYGALGSSLAKALSDRLGIPYYDRDFVKKTVEKSGYEQEEVEQESEDMSTSTKMLNSFLNSAVSFSSSYDRIFAAQKQVVLELAVSPCIIVGRCADHILKEAGIDALSIFLFASVNDRRKVASELAENGDMNLDKYIEKRDKLRRTYYKTYTGCEMGNANNYTICFDTGKISIPTCVDIIMKILEQD
jgi:cytidylate kinase